MGILKFYKKLIKNYADNDAIIEIDKKLLDKKYDYIFFDFQSLIYTVYQLFSCEINYFLRLIYHIRYLINNNININFKYKNVIKYILNKYKNYFITIYENNYIPYLNGLLNYDINIVNKILLINYRNEIILINILIEDVIDLVKKISNNHIKLKNIFDKIFIFFEGIPTKSKIKDQLYRKIYSEISRNIRYDLIKNNIASDIEIEIRNLLLSETPPGVGIDNIFNTKIYDKLNEMNSLLKDKININNITNYGEAEHQIMIYINNNINKFKNTNILLISPDSDLIILSMINYIKNIKIDIIKIIRINPDNEYTNMSDYLIKNKKIISPFYYKYSYIFIDKIIKLLNLNTKQELLDISYILLLLGDDYLPGMPEININSIQDIINIYKNINIKLINIKNNDINYNNFIILIKELDEIPKKYTKKLNKHFINHEIKRLKYLYNYYFYYDYKDNLEMFNRMYFLNKGIVKNNNKLELIIDNKINKKINDKNTINYLQGCKFIFDIYINDKIVDYNWVYKYDVAPTLKDIYLFLENKEDIKNIFNYKSSNYNKFLSFKTYKNYLEYLKVKNMKNILKKIGIKEKIKKSNIEELSKKYIIYKNIKKIFKCSGDNIFINKCFNIKYISKKIPDNMIIKLDY